MGCSGCSSMISASYRLARPWTNPKNCLQDEWEEPGEYLSHIGLFRNASRRHCQEYPNAVPNRVFRMICAGEEIPLNIKMFTLHHAPPLGIRHDLVTEWHAAASAQRQDYAK